MTSDFMYKLMLFIANKSQNGYITPQQFNLSINQAQNSYLNYLLGEFQQYAPTRPIGRVEMGMNEILQQRLSPFIDVPYTLTVDVSGQSSYPPNYQQIVAMYTNTGFSRIRYVEQDKLYSYYNSVIDPLSTNPIYSIYSDGFQFYPTTIANAKISYIRTPPEIIWAYIEDDNGRPIYDSGNSVDPLWNDVDCLDIISRALSMVGVNLQSAAILQYSNQIKQGGQ